MIQKIRVQLNSKNQRKICAKRNWRIQKFLIYFFRVIYVFNKTTLKTKLFRLHHENFLTNHFDMKKIKNLINRKYFWFRMIVNVNEYVKKCNIYQRTKTSRHRLYNELQLLFISTRSWNFFLNFITKLFLNCYENDVYDVILIVVCRLSKITLYVHVKSIWTTKKINGIFFDRVLFAYSKIKNIVSNKKSLFINKY